MATLSFAEFESGARRAETQVASGQWRSALDTYAHLLQRRVEDLRFHADALTDTDLVVFERVADIAIPLGETAAADALYAVACDAHHHADPRRFVHAALKRVQIALAADRFGDAMRLVKTLEPALGRLIDIACTDEGLAAWEDDRPWRPDEAAPLEAQLYLVLGRLLAGSGQFDDASAFFRRGLVYASADRPALARQAGPPLQLALAAAALGRGDVAGARTILAQVDPSAAGRPGDVVRRHELDALANVLAGQFGRALAALGAAADICRANGFSQALASVLLSRAKLFLITNQTAEADADIAQAQHVGIFLRVPALVDRCGRLLQYARARRHTLFGGAPLADPAALLQMGTRADGAIDGSSRTLAVTSGRPSDFLAYYEERELDLMTVAQEEGPTARIDGLLQLLAEDFGHTDSPYVLARLQLLRGVSGVQRQDWPAALAHCASAADAFQRLDIPSDEYVARRFESLCCEHHPDGAGTLSFVRGRAQQLLESLTAAMSVSAREAYLVNKWSQRESEIADAVTRLVAERRRIQQRPAIGRWLGLAGWSARVAALHRTLVDVDGQAWSATAGPLRRWWQGWRAVVCHPRDEQTINFVALANGVVRVSMRWCRCDLDWLPVPRGHLRSLVRRFHEQMAVGNPRSERLAAAAAAAVSAALQLPQLLAGLPPRVRRLTIFPDDQLHVLPFAVLPVIDDTLVVDRWATTIGVRRVRPRGTAAAASRVTLAATTGDGGADLPGAAEQMRWLAQWWRAHGAPPVTLSGTECDEARFLAALTSTDVFHFSGHGRFNPDSPDGTGVVVDGAGERGDVISLSRLANADCRGLRFATFLSCWSADSFLFPGRWAVSIPSALCRAGAACVVAPLWEIEDSMSTELLRAVYGGLESGRIDEAVRQAQLRARTDTHGASRSPFLWAGLQVYGDGARLTLARGARWRH